ncbi:MAG: AMIN domain-containing protein [Methylotenera sp.]
MNNFFAKFLFVSAFSLANISSYAATVIAASVLPVSEYTRITIESDQAIVHAMLILKKPDRVVLDLKNVAINQSLKALTSNVLPEDFYIKKVRVANFKQGVTRVVVDLKTAAAPKLSTYKPAGGYQHRLALDIYPVKAEEIGVESAPSNEAPMLDAKESSSSNGTGIVLERNPVFEPEMELQKNVE